MDNTQGEDNKLEKFFPAVPRLFKSGESDISVVDLHESDQFWNELDGFLHRTLSSDSVIESVKTSRLDAYLNLINERSKYHILRALGDLFRGTFGHLPQTIKRTNILARWCTDPDEDIALTARCAVARLLRSSQTRDYHWAACARDQLDIPHHLLPDIIDHNEHAVSLAIFIQMVSRISDLRYWEFEILSKFSDFDVQQAPSRLQNEFCALWNKIVEEAKKQEYSRYPVYILHTIRHFYIALHQDTKAAPTAFHASTSDFDDILLEPLSYPLCDLHHHQKPTTSPTIASPLVSQIGGLPSPPAEHGPNGL